MNLRPYQIDGSRRMAALPAAVLGDEMGLGKTAQGLHLLDSLAPSSAIIVCPPIAKGVWHREFAKWSAHLSPTVLSGRGSFRWPRNGEAIITNYDILPVSKRYILEKKKIGKAVDPGLMLPPNPPQGMIVIGDEAHYCKSGKAERTHATRQVCIKAVTNGGRAYALTGTPIKNSPVDLFHIFATFQVLQHTFYNYPNFVKMMGGLGSGRDLHWTEPSPLARQILDKWLIRRTQAEVLPEIPSRTDSEIPVELSSVAQHEMERIIASAGWEIKDITPETFHQFLNNEHMMRARACLASAKVQAAIDWCHEAEACGEPVVVFSAHRDAVKRVGSRPGWEIIDGDTPAGKRTAIEDAFQSGKLKGVSANIQAGGVAITLTRARMMLFVDKAWTNADNQQAAFRILRIGQTRPVNIYSMVADHPLDERIAEILSQKDKDAEAVLGDERRKRERITDEIFASI